MAQAIAMQGQTTFEQSGTTFIIISAEVSWQLVCC